MMETQRTLMEKIKEMEDWLNKHRYDDDKIPMISSERSKFINKLSAVAQHKRDADAILRFFSNGQVFNIPKEMKEK